MAGQDPPSAHPIDRRKLLRLMGGSLAGAAVASRQLAASSPAGAAEPVPGELPNIVLIYADDLGYGELGCYGQQRIRTPHIDQLAADGQRFTQCYAGGALCAPSRASILTGIHTGHGQVRNNSGPALSEGDTIAELLRDAGYATGLIGKWGMGSSAETVPNARGFDEFFGYLGHNDAHDYHPATLWRDRTEVPIPENADGAEGVYSPDLFLGESLDFIRRHRDQPFFLFFSTTVPHAPNVAPTAEPYANEPWPEGQKFHAAQITRMDRDVGSIMALLRTLDIDANTIVVFTSDNGPHEEGGRAPYLEYGGEGIDPRFFDANGPLRGYKRNLYEGGIRIPAIVRTPVPVIARLQGRSRATTPTTPPAQIPGSVSDRVWAQWDLLPTVAEVAAVTAPDGIDGLSVLPLLIGQPQPDHDHLYWEADYRYSATTYPLAAAEDGLVEGRSVFAQAVRKNDWKAVRRGFCPPTELYDLAADPGETVDLASQHADVVAELEAIMAAARAPSPDDPPLRTVAAVADPQLLERPGETSTLRVTVTNQVCEAVAGTVEVSAPDEWSVTPTERSFALTGKGASRELEFTASSPPDAERSGEFQVIVRSRGHVIASTVCSVLIDSPDLNWALLATMSASSTHPRFSTARVNDGSTEAQTDYAIWNAGGGWNDETPDRFPDWLAASWDRVVELSRVRVFTVNSSRNPAEVRGIRDYDVQVLVDGSWQTVASVRDNVDPTIESSFVSVETTALRLFITDSNDHHYSRVVEVEAYRV